MAKASRYRKLKGEDFAELEVSHNKKHLPHLHFTLADLPEAKDWKVGKTYDLNLQVKQTGVYDTEHQDGVEFEVLAVSVPNQKRYAKKETEA